MQDYAVFRSFQRAHHSSFCLWAYSPALSGKFFFLSFVATLKCGTNNANMLNMFKHQSWRKYILPKQNILLVFKYYIRILSFKHMLWPHSMAETKWVLLFYIHFALYFNSNLGQSQRRIFIKCPIQAHLYPASLIITSHSLTDPFAIHYQ